MGEMELLIPNSFSSYCLPVLLVWVELQTWNLSECFATRLWMHGGMWKKLREKLMSCLGTKTPSQDAAKPRGDLICGSWLFGIAPRLWQNVPRCWENLGCPTFWASGVEIIICKKLGGHSLCQHREDNLCLNIHQGNASEVFYIMGILFF